MIRNSILLMMTAAGLALTAGCGGKTEDSAATTPNSADTAAARDAGAKADLSEAAKTAAQQASATADKAVTAVKDTVAAQKPAVEQAAQNASSLATDAGGQAQGMIDKVKTLMADKNYQDALATLKQLANTKLTPEQQKLVDDLKRQLQTAMAGKTANDAASSLGKALGGNK
jgi:hypothetical protein